MMPNDWSLDGRGRRVFARLDVMRSVNQCAERALRGKAGLLARLEAHGVSNRQAARIIRVSAPAFGNWWCRGRWPDCDRVAQAFALLADLDAGTIRPRKVFEVEAGRYASAGADFTALLAEGLAELDERGFRSAQVSGQAQIEPADAREGPARARAALCGRAAAAALRRDGARRGLGAGAGTRAHGTPAAGDTGERAEHLRGVGDGQPLGGAVMAPWGYAVSP